MTDKDGISLMSTAHPRSRFWWLKAIWWRIFPPDVNLDALETIEIDLPDTP